MRGRLWGVRERVDFHGYYSLWNRNDYKIIVIGKWIECNYRWVRLWTCLHKSFSKTMISSCGIIHVCGVDYYNPLIRDCDLRVELFVHWLAAVSLYLSVELFVRMQWLVAVARLRQCACCLQTNQGFDRNLKDEILFCNIRFNNS